MVIKEEVEREQGRKVYSVWDNNRETPKPKEKDISIRAKKVIEQQSVMCSKETTLQTFNVNQPQKSQR